MKTKIKYPGVFILIIFVSLFISCNKNNDSQPLTEQSLQNLVAFTKLYGYVRYFHPSTEAQKIDWDKFAIYGASKVEHANGSNELKNVLNDLFLPIAPTLKIYNRNDFKQEELKIYTPPDSEKLNEVVWKHHGFVVSENSSTYYKYIGENKPDSVFKNLPVHDKIFRTEIGAELSIIMPIVLHSDSVGSLPRGDTNNLKDLIKDYDRDEKFNIFDRYVRFADIAITWNIMQHFYIYFDVIKTNWPAELPTALKKAATDTSDIDFLNTLKRFTALLNDGHCDVMYPSPDHNSYYSGLRWEVIENHLVITQVLDEINDKIKPGDIVIEIDGSNALDKLASFDSLVSGATTGWKRVDNYLYPRNSTKKGSLEILASGKENSVLKLKVLHADSSKSSVELLRTHNFYNLQKKNDIIFEISKGIHYIDMTRCTLADYNGYRLKLKNAKGIIYDCRGFPRMFDFYLSDMTKDSITAAFKMFSYLILYPDRSNINYEIYPPLVFPGSSDYLKAPKVIITNSRAISSAESVILTAQHCKLATIVGEHTAGTSGVMNGFLLPGNYYVIFTGHKFLNADGSQFHGIGVIPDIPVSRTIKGVLEGKDEQLDKAIEVVTSRMKK